MDSSSPAAAAAPAMPDGLRELLKTTVREWVRIDNEINALNKEVSVRKAKKTDLSSKLIEITRQTGLDMFDFNGGQLMYVRKSKKKAITQKQLLSLIANYLGDEQKADDMHKYIMDSREETVVEQICRK
jgi:hypothetical protein